MNRREFMKSSAVFSAMMASAPSILNAQGKRTFNVALVGCGGRGNGAAGNLVEAAKIVGVEVKFVAAADYFVDKAKNFAKKMGFDEKNCFGGTNGYKAAIAVPGVDIVILTTPLNFRAIHLKACIDAGKHVFAEKGVAVDGATVRLFIQASKEAAEKHLTIVAGTQRRHQRGYRLQAKAIAEGKVGPILGGAVYWNGSVPWVKNRDAGESNASYLCKNWLNFTELSGDHICEQHVHNIDIANWFLGRYPKTALCFGMRARRFSGNQYDMFSTDFDYGDDVHIHSMCRQIDGCYGGVYEKFRTADAVISGGGKIIKNGQPLDLQGDFQDGNPYVVEHCDLLRSIMGTGPYYNEGEAVAMSTACAVIARISACTGQIVRMSDILEKKDSPFYNMDCVPTPADFEKYEAEGKDVAMPQYADNQFPLPGKPWRELHKK
ncbi:MAG: Gfo/Idh/MocA family oxidoreductase [Kiritimatiellae bacterium]|nr:Gfo/Idh/MocA family oxidoreductase [Kiritimatiellia bacterium]